MEKIWKEIQSRYNLNEPTRYTCNYFHASPGIGKTYLFNQLSFKYPDDIPNIYKDIQDEVQFVGITFNSNTSYKELFESKLSYLDVFWSRVIYAEFIDQSVTWGNFLEEYINMIKNDAISIDVFLQMLINKYKTKKMFVFLIDEITKITDSKLRDELRSYICELQDRNDKIKALAFFSTLDPTIISYQVAKTSERPVIAITQLSLFSIKNSILFLDKLFEDHKIELIIKSKTVSDVTKQRVLMYLSALSSGHPRTLESIVLAIEAELNSSSRSGFALQEVFKLTTRKFNYPDIFSNINIVKISCLGDDVKLDKYIDQDDEKLTIYDLITSGVFLASLDQNRLSAQHDKISPKIPLLLLYYWANKKYDQIRIAGILDNIFKLSYHWNSNSFDFFHAYWEMLFRSLNEGNSTYKSISIYNYYKKPKIVINKNDVLHLKIDLSTDLEIQYFDDKERVNIDISNIYLPSDQLNAGFDSLIFVNANDNSKKRKRSYLALFFQNKISDLDTTTELKLTDIKNSINKSKTFLNNRIVKTGTIEIIPVFIFLSMRSIQKQLSKIYQPENEEELLNDNSNVQQYLNNHLKLNDNIMILDESDLEKLYGVNLFQIPNYLRTGILPKEIIIRECKNSTPHGLG